MKNTVSFTTGNSVFYNRGQSMLADELKSYFSFVPMKDGHLERCSNFVSFIQSLGLTTLASHPDFYLITTAKNAREWIDYRNQIPDDDDIVTIARGIPRHGGYFVVGTDFFLAFYDNNITNGIKIVVQNGVDRLPVLGGYNFADILPTHYYSTKASQALRMKPTSIIYTGDGVIETFSDMDAPIYPANYIYFKDNCLAGLWDTPEVTTLMSYIPQSAVCSDADAKRLALVFAKGLVYSRTPIPTGPEGEVTGLYVAAKSSQFESVLSAMRKMETPKKIALDGLPLNSQRGLPLTFYMSAKGNEYIPREGMDVLTQLYTWSQFEQILCDENVAQLEGDLSPTEAMWVIEDDGLQELIEEFNEHVVVYTNEMLMAAERFSRRLADNVDSALNTEMSTALKQIAFAGTIFAYRDLLSALCSTFNLDEDVHLVLPNWLSFTDLKFSVGYVGEIVTGLSAGSFVYPNTSKRPRSRLLESLPTVAGRSVASAVSKYADVLSSMVTLGGNSPAGLSTVGSLQAAFEAAMQSVLYYDPVVTHSRPSWLVVDTFTVEKGPDNFVPVFDALMPDSTLDVIRAGNEIGPTRNPAGWCIKYTDQYPCGAIVDCAPVSADSTDGEFVAYRSPMYAYAANVRLRFNGDQAEINAPWTEGWTSQGLVSCEFDSETATYKVVYRFIDDEMFQKTIYFAKVVREYSLIEERIATEIGIGNACDYFNTFCEKYTGIGNKIVQHIQAAAGYISKESTHSVSWTTFLKKDHSDAVYHESGSVRDETIAICARMISNPAGTNVAFKADYIVHPIAEYYPSASSPETMVGRFSSALAVYGEGMSYECTIKSPPSGSVLYNVMDTLSLGGLSVLDKVGGAIKTYFSGLSPVTAPAFFMTAQTEWSASTVDYQFVKRSVGNVSFRAAAEKVWASIRSAAVCKAFIDIWPRLKTVLSESGTKTVILRIVGGSFVPMRTAQLLGDATAATGLMGIATACRDLLGVGDTPDEKDVISDLNSVLQAIVKAADLVAAEPNKIVLVGSNPNMNGATGIATDKSGYAGTALLLTYGGHE